MTTWYLVIILSVGSGNSQQHLEFKSKEACLIAADEIRQGYDPEYHQVLKTICVKDS